MKEVTRCQTDVRFNAAVPVAIFHVRQEPPEETEKSAILPQSKAYIEPFANRTVLECIHYLKTQMSLGAKSFAC